MRKNIVIAILLVIIAGLCVPLYQANQFSKTFVIEVIPTLDKQREACDTLTG